MYLSVVMDLYSRKIIGWTIDKRMTVDLVERSIQMAITLRQPEDVLFFILIVAHSIPVAAFRNY